jgi:hypothetical protein
MVRRDLEYQSILSPHTHLQLVLSTRQLTNGTSIVEDLKIIMFDVWDKASVAIVLIFRLMHFFDKNVPMERYERSERRTLPNGLDQGVLSKVEGIGGSTP